MKNTKSTGNTKSAAEVFALLHASENNTLEAITSNYRRALEGKQVTFITWFGIVVGEVWKLTDGWDLWYSSSKNSNIFAPTFTRCKHFSTLEELREFAWENARA